MSTEEKRTHVTVELKNKRLGMYLEPADDDNRGAVLQRFEPVDGSPGEAEKSGLLRPGFRLTAINDSNLMWSQFPSIIAVLVNSARPVRITFKDPDVHEFRDRYNFIRTKLHIDREAIYLASIADFQKKHDLRWLQFFTELGGQKGPMYGAARLMRDACGDIVFPLEPSVRLNAVSPLHGRMTGISSTATATPPKARTASTSSAPGRKLSETPRTPQRPTANNAAPPTPSSVVISIYKRCWGPSSIGVAVPPGLAVNLPGDLPKPKQREKYYSTLQQLVVYGGVPAAYRPVVWYEMSGAHAKACLHPPGYYASLCTMKPSSEAGYAIAKDLDRTFPGHPFFESKAGIASLYRLLSAFSVHNSEIGYCQSINFVAGFLLLLMPEENAFWVLDVLVNEILPPDYYHNALLGVHVDQRVLAHLVDELVPEVSASLAKAGIQLQVLTVEWFMCCFCTVLPTNTAFRVWDAVFLYGSEVLFKVALVLFFQCKDRLLSVAQSSTKSTITIKSTPVTPPEGETAAAAGTKVTVASVPSSRKSALPTKDTVAETANRVLAAVAAAGVTSSAVRSPSSPDNASRSGSPASRQTSADSGADKIDFNAALGRVAEPFSPIARGGTVRSPASTFPALFAMLKSMPSTAHDADEIMRLAYPANPKEAKASLPWEYVTPARTAKLRLAGRQAVQAEYEEAQSIRQLRAGIVPTSALKPSPVPDAAPSTPKIAVPSARRSNAGIAVLPPQPDDDASLATHTNNVTGDGHVSAFHAPESDVARAADDQPMGALSKPKSPLQHGAVSVEDASSSDKADDIDLECRADSPQYTI